MNPDDSLRPDGKPDFAPPITGEKITVTEDVYDARIRIDCKSESGGSVFFDGSVNSKNPNLGDYLVSGQNKPMTTQDLLNTADKHGYLVNMNSMSPSEIANAVKNAEPGTVFLYKGYLDMKGESLTIPKGVTFLVQPDPKANPQDPYYYGIRDGWFGNVGTINNSGVLAVEGSDFICERIDAYTGQPGSIYLYRNSNGAALTNRNTIQTGDKVYAPIGNGATLHDNLKVSFDDLLKNDADTGLTKITALLIGGEWVTEKGTYNDGNGSIYKVDFEKGEMEIVFGAGFSADNGSGFEYRGVDNDGQPVDGTGKVEINVGDSASFDSLPPSYDGTGGNDTITADDGDYIINGGGGHDTIMAGHGDNIINGYDGDDKIFVGGGNNTIDGGSGDDKILVEGDGNNTIHGGEGRDVIWVDGDGNNTIHGDGGNDYIVGGGGDDKLFGDAGDDVIFGMAGDDYLDGGAGRDELYGGSGNDILVYDQADSVIDGGEGIDFLVGVDKGSLDSLFGQDSPMHGVEVLVLEGGAPITSLTDLGNLGISVEGDALKLGSGWTADASFHTESGGSLPEGYQAFTQDDMTIIVQKSVLETSQG